jgi:hypothetical protein
MPYKCRKKLKSDLSRRYNLSLATYEALLQGCNYSCMICGKSRDEGAVLCVEHCNETSKTRGITCNFCNLAISYLDHDPKLLRKAAEYLEDN